MRISGTRLALIASAALCGPVADAGAAEAEAWSGQITPYVWGSGLGGDVTPFTGAPRVSFDKSFSEVIEDLDAAFFVSGFARRGRFVALGDLSYSSSSKDGRIPPGLPAEGSLRQTSLTLAAGYRAVDRPQLTVDVLAGLRAWRVRGSAEVPLAGIARSPKLDFTDPLLAARANYGFAPRWSAVFYGDVGVFGGGSEHTRQLLATVNYQASQHVYVSAGLRRLDVDYRSGGTRIDATLAGPLVGVTWRF